jgi:hypothetical protein
MGLLLRDWLAMFAAHEAFQWWRLNRLSIARGAPPTLPRAQRDGSANRCREQSDCDPSVAGSSSTSMIAATQPASSL